ncbi:uncharacterized protein N7477_001762 [Penicillium maclennaniae]|uniref:uncharacterized protein n=1 Tax=Penicillium maclennaniae TaxID=1343394 RepID=UPI0025421541|nr:uncharacterized protein N7477_001762 [Penicillium maclennaniae]KAJ5681822.1 hypothetical protein N7477_001762 [Penicillium maclennaniae]
MFTPIHTSLGALLLFEGSSGLLFHNGAVFGISSLISESVFSPSRDNVPIVAGLMSSVLPVYLLAPSLIPNYPASPNSLASVLTTLGVGILLGWGTKNGRGCTSGHMLCGLSRLSPRSLIATAVFFTSALITANFANGGSNIPSCGSTPCYTPVYPSSNEVVFMTAAVLLSSMTNFLVVPKMMHRSRDPVPSSPTSQDWNLDLAYPSRFDPSLALIILFGIGPSLSTYLMQSPGRISKNEKKPTKPTLAEQWRLPTALVADIDWRFVAGAVAFGVAWGLRGVCPGPAVLRSVLQPTWGLSTMSGYILGNMF